MAYAKFNFPLHIVQDQWPNDSMQIKYGSGYSFASKPKGTPQLTFILSFTAMWRWFDDNGTIDRVYSPKDAPGTNLSALDDFYEAVECWQPFEYVHPTRGTRIVRFSKPITLPKNIPGAMMRSNGMWGHQVEPFQVEFIDQPL